MSRSQAWLRRATGARPISTSPRLLARSPLAVRCFEGEPALEARHVYEARQVLTSGFSVHVARIRLDPATGFFRVLDYVATHDAGRALNRMIVDGQVVGAVADGIGGAMLAEIVHDADGQPLTGSLADYLVATAPEIPPVRVLHVDSPSGTNPLDVRAVGEGGIIPVAAALANAVARAIDPARSGGAAVFAAAQARARACGLPARGAGLVRRRARSHPEC